ncbi:MAG TPA: hypothetical protein VKG43_08220 [Acidimicrobiales bacterium]|nr:hypothetical protein [Acidimicrobiales bacterium]
MKLVYQDIPTDAGTADVVVLHREGVFRIDQAVTVARASGAARRVVGAFGDYGVLRSGMELGGLAWYRALPGYAGTDPISLAKAVLQVTDLLDGLADSMPAPELVGWGQGAVVAAGVGSLFGGKVRSVACFDAEPGHLDALPEPAEGSPVVPVLVGATSEDPATLDRLAQRLGDRGAPVTTWAFDGTGDPGEAEALRLGPWLSGGG